MNKDEIAEAAGVALGMHEAVKAKFPDLGCVTIVVPREGLGDGACFSTIPPDRLKMVLAGMAAQIEAGEDTFMKGDDGNYHRVQ